MPLNKLENFIKNYEGRILYVNSNDLDATDSITNQGNSLTKPFKTIQRALIEAARFSFVIGEENDYNGRTTILVFPGEHVIDNRPGFGILKTGTSTASAVAPNGDITAPASSQFGLTLDSNFDLTQENNVLYKFNSIYGGAIIPRGTSIVGLDLRKTKIRPKYVPNPTDELAGDSAIFRLTGQCYFWQFSFFDADEKDLVYTDPRIFSAGSGNLATPTFSHHKLTCFEYADGVNVPTGYDITDLDMYYAKLSQAFNEGSGRQIPAAQKYPLSPKAFAKERAEWEIVGAFAEDPVQITNIIAGDGATPSPIVTVTTIENHELTVGTPIKIRGLNVQDYNVSTVVASVIDEKNFTYVLPFVRNNLPASPSGSANVTIETDTVKGASPYVFNCSLRSVWGLNGMHADGNKASGFRSMVVAQFTGVSLQKDDRAFVKYDPVTRTYSGIPITKVTGSLLSSGSASTDNNRVYHLDTNAIYRTGWETTHIKLSNDAFIQVVSVFAIGYTRHFESISGGDASITNSNSNFGQIALVANGFKKEAFSKDDAGFITNIITPKYVPPTERNIDWISLDVGLTTAVGITSHLYLFGFNSEDNVPPNLIQGYRVGAKMNDRLFLDLPDGSTSSAEILMSENFISGSSPSIIGNTSSVMEYQVTQVPVNSPYENLTLSPNHKLQTGQKIVLISENGDLPENIVPDRVYYVISVDNGQSNQIKVASSFTNASNGVALPIYGGTKLRVLSRISNIDSGEAGSPIQFDPNNNNWFIHVEPNNELYNSINSFGIVGFEEPRTDVTYFKRVGDDRSIDDKVYKIRFVIPKDIPNAKDPSEGFVIQESSTTGALTDSEFTLTSLTNNDIYFNRNPRYISTCTFTPNPLGVGAGTIEVTTEKPHNLNANDRVFIKNVSSSTNLTGFGLTGFNGDFTIQSVPSDKTFVYSAIDNAGIEHNVGIFSGPSSRTTELPRFERNDLKSNLFIYRTDVIRPYEYTAQDGIYHLYVLNASNTVPEHFTENKYGQNIVNLYPQLDRDNYNDNPPAAKSFAKRFPVGDVVTNDLKKSVTRETLDILLKKLHHTPIVSSTSPTSAGIATITTTLEHGFNGIIGVSNISSGTGYSDGVYYNVKLLNSDNSWNGASAKITVSSGVISAVDIMASGSGYNNNQTLKINDFSGSTVLVTNSVISSPIRNSLQISGIGTASDFLCVVQSVPSDKTIAIARTSGDPVVYPGQYLYNVAPISFVSSQNYNSSVGITTLTFASAHGLALGNKIKIIDNSNNNLGDYLVSQVVGINTIAIRANVPSTAHRVLKYGFAANDLFSAAGGENLATRGVSLYGNESAILDEELIADTSGNTSTFSIIANDGQGGPGIATASRFPIGSYIQIGEEIMRVSSSTLVGAGNRKISAIRGYFGTRKISHEKGSLIKKISPIPIEFRRPSVARASGHTFEYLGYGPGNYSTGLPQIQAKTLSDREDFLAQSQEQSCGQVIYTGMNSDGDFFIGNTKYSASSGTQETYDIPIATVTGQDPSRLSVVFDEAIVKERILVEGGKSKQILSQFDGPVTFNENIIMNDEVKINGELILSNLLRQNNVTDSHATNNGSIVTKGGVGIAKNLNVGGNFNVTGIATFNGEVIFSSGLVPDNLEDAYLGSSSKPWGSAWIAGIGIATEGIPGGTEVEDRTINAWTGDLVLKSQVGIVSVTDSLEVTDDLLVKRNTYLTGIATVATGLVPDQDKGSYIGAIGNAFEEAHIDGIRIGYAGTTTIDTRGGNLVLDSDGGLVDINDNLDVSGTSILQGEVTLNTGIVPDADEGAYVGTSLLPFSEAHIGEIRIAFNNNNGEIDTATGGLTLDSDSGIVTVDDNLTVNNNLQITGTSNFDDSVTIKGTGKTFIIKDGLNNNRFTVASNDGNTFISGSLQIDGNTTIGNATSDTLTVAANSEFNGTVDIDDNFAVRSGTTDKFTVASSTGNTVIAGTLNVTGNTTLSLLDVDNVRINSNTVTTTTGNLVLDSTGGTIEIKDNVNISGTLVVDGNSTLGNATTDVTTVNGNLRVTQDITAFYTSDRRLKDNINPIAEALNKVKSISGNTYTWNETSTKTGDDVGVIAQEVQKVLPEAVIERDNGYLAVDYQKIIPLLIESIKELNQKVELLEQKLTDK